MSYFINLKILEFYEVAVFMHNKKLFILDCYKLI